MEEIPIDPLDEAGEGTRSRRLLSLHVREARVLDWLAELLHWFEIGLATISVIFVALGVLFLLNELLHFREGLESIGLHTSFEELLADILLLVVGIELALMLVRRTPEALIEVMFFVVARKMLIKSDETWDLVLGVLALAGLFAIRKYLEYVPIKQSRIPGSHSHNPATEDEQSP
jgi:hypothetical protein